MATKTAPAPKKSPKKTVGKKAPVTKKAAQKKEAAKDLSKSYNEFKEFEGKQYTGMRIGRSHKWNYDPGEWIETKITPDLWQISYAVTKRRKGHAPEGSGVPVGTEYHWYIMAHQHVRKLNANDYTTSMSGLKYKLAHKRADKENWSATAKTQRKHLANLLKEMLAQLESEPIPIGFEYNGEKYEGEAIPISQTCHDGICEEWDVTLNDSPMGVIRCAKKGWKMEGVEDKKLVDAIGEAIFLWYE